jgi:hypothetical protein
LRSTSNSRGGEVKTQDVETYDGYGFGCTYNHLVALLRSKDFAKYLKDVRAVADPAEEEEVANQGKKKTRTATDLGESSSNLVAAAKKQPSTPAGSKNDQP